MQTLLLACYICLQLTSIPSESTLGDLLKRDTSCDQCLTGLFDSSKLVSNLGTQTAGELLLSNQALQEALQEKLMNQLHKSVRWTRNQSQEVTQDREEQINKVNMNVKDMLKEMDLTIENMQEKDVDEMKITMKEMVIKLEARQADLLMEQMMKRQPEMVNKNEEPAMKEVKQQQINVPNRNILRNEEKLVVGESLVSENGRFKATMKNSGLVVITDQRKDDRVVKEFGEPRSDNPESELYLMVQANGNLVIKDEDMSIWHCGRMSPMSGRSHFLKLDNDGQIVVYNAWNYRVWTSGFPE